MIVQRRCLKSVKSTLLSSKLGFNIEKETKEAMLNSRLLIEKLAMERVHARWSKYSWTILKTST